MPICSSVEDQALGAVFYISRVCALELATTPNNSMTVLWYWPKMPQGSTNAVGELHKQYVNWETRS